MDHARTTTPSTSVDTPTPRPAWTAAEILALLELPLLDLLWRAQQVHRAHHDPHAVQRATLLSVKTGGCPEDCGYCPQSAHYDTGLGRDGLLPGFLAGVNAGGTPVPALLITAGGAALLVLAGSFERLLGMGAFLYVGLPLVGVAALLWLRRREPDLERPFRSWGYPLTPLLVGAVSLAFLLAALWSDTLNSLLALALAIAGSALLQQTPGLAQAAGLAEVAREGDHR